MKPQSNVDMSAGVAALTSIVGRDRIVVDQDGLELESRTNIFQRHIPDIVLYPQSTAEVQEVFRAANEFRWPVWPVSRGKNWGYGSKSASYPGGITLVLERMDKIHEVNEELGYAVIEPGVSYKQLNDHLKATASRLWTDSTGSTKYGSVIGNAMDKGRGVTPYADHFGCLCGMEVVLPDGRKVVTGGGPDNQYRSWNTYKWGIGPYLDGLFAQSNFGVVTKAGIWLMPAPEKYDFFIFEYTAGESQFGAFLDDVRGLVFSGTMQAYPHLANAFAMLCIISQYPHDLLDGGSCLSDGALAKWRKQYGISNWTFGCGVYGTAAEVRVRKTRLKKILGKYGSAHFFGRWGEKGLKGKFFRGAVSRALPMLGKSPKLLEILGDAVDLFRGIPTDYFARQVYVKSHAEKPSGDNIDPPRDGCGLIWIGPVAPFTSMHINRVLDTVTPFYKRHGFDFFVELIVESARSVIVLFGIFFDKENEEELQRARALYNEIRETMMEQGYPPYRSSIASTEQTLDYSPDLQRVLNEIKTVMDPHHILAPGKYGIGNRPKDAVI